MLCFRNIFSVGKSVTDAQTTLPYPSFISINKRRRPCVCVCVGKILCKFRKQEEASCYILLDASY